ncbi:nuclear transport factor 2 family protein [Geothrix sp. 21YS21S-4]|uniref:nuclear transport factor 2 family protein n=1 Tax=Geothrix sp. 21YS21S-4 TaxID=3068889 RepID=UPI0027BA203C|nr:nuclear transport factor 2 family protein [Geothrix sp. 21YS21S-4]
MKRVARLAVFPALAALFACRPAPSPSPVPQPAPASPDARTVLAFLDAYGRRDLDGMMAQLDEDAVFRGSGAPLAKPQIRAFFQDTFRKHPDLRVEVGSVTVVRGAVHARVTVQTDTLWARTWIFEMKDHRIRAYSLAAGKR